jgi:hypothetical protein
MTIYRLMDLWLFVLLFLSFNILISFVSKIFKLGDPLVLIGTDSLILVNAAIGEEFVFRIFPNILFKDPVVHFLISGPLFGILHCIPLLRDTRMWREKILQSISVLGLGTMLLLSKQYFYSDSYWYTFCCFYHNLNNLLALCKQKYYYHNEGTNGFVMLNKTNTN